MRSWFLGLCVGFVLIMPTAKNLLAQARNLAPSYDGVYMEDSYEYEFDEIDLSDDAQPA